MVEGTGAVLKFRTLISSTEELIIGKCVLSYYDLCRASGHTTKALVVFCLGIPWGHLIAKMSSYQYRDPMLNIRWYHDLLIFNMGKTVFMLGRGPGPRNNCSGLGSMPRHSARTLMCIIEHKFMWRKPVCILQCSKLGKIVYWSPKQVTFELYRSCKMFIGTASQTTLSKHCLYQLISMGTTRQVVRGTTCLLVSGWLWKQSI